MVDLGRSAASMRPAFFAILSLAWLTVMGALAALGPLGRHVAASMLLYGGGFILLFAVIKTFPEDLTGPRAFAFVIFLGVAARLAFLSFPPGNDIYRYIWEGAVQNHGFNPYLLAPESPQLASLAEGELRSVWVGINHKWFSAIYPPLPLLLFRAMALVSPTPIFFKGVFLLADLGVMVLLARLIRTRGLPASRLLLYAANPLVIVFVAGEGHLDVLQALFLCLACLGLERGKGSGGLGGAFCLGLAVMTKYLAAAAVPFLLRRDAGIRNLAVLIPLVLFLPYIEAGTGLFGTLAAFGTATHYNDSLTAVLRWVLGDGALPMAAACLAAALLWVWLIEDDPLRGAYLAFACLLVFLPTVHPWYLLLVAPLLCLFPSPAWLVLQVGVLFTFPVMAGELASGVFQEIHWLKLPEYAPFFGVLAWGLLRGVDRSPGSDARMAPGTVSVLIPTLNEAGTLGRCLASFADAAEVREVIVADGGSTDDTVRVAAAAGAKVVVGARSRGGQIRAGSEAASGDVLLVVHADCTLAPRAPRRVLDALAARPEAAGGCFGMAFDDGGWSGAVISGLNNLRAAATGIAFGDQAQFVRADTLARIGGFPPLMLMEDVELSLRMKRAGRMLYLGRGVTVSGRRWRAGQYWGHLRVVVSLFFRFLIERRFGRTHRFDEKYYRVYYGDGIEGK